MCEKFPKGNDDVYCDSVLCWHRTGVCGNVLLQVPNLVTPLSENPQRVLEKSNHDQETTNHRQVRFQRLRVDFDIILDCFAESFDLLERVIWIRCSISRRRARIGKTVWVGAVVGLRAGYVDSRRHDGARGSRSLATNVSVVTTWLAYVSLKVAPLLRFNHFPIKFYN